MGQPPVRREWHPRHQLSALRAISPEGQRDVHGQDGALNAAAVLALLQHLLREVPGRLVIIWDGSPIHRRPTSQEVLSHGAAPRSHLERLPA